MAQNNTTTEIEGFKNWLHFYEFVSNKYSDVSIALIKKDFKAIREMMRELIDNSYPYHSNKIEIIIKKDQEDEKILIEYADYFEKLVADLDIIENDKNNSVDPHQKQLLAVAKDNFIIQTRTLRRLIMRDLAIAGIIPHTTKKTERAVNPALLRGD